MTDPKQSVPPLPTFEELLAGSHLYEAMNAAVALLAPDGVILFSNSAWRDLDNALMVAPRESRVIGLLMAPGVREAMQQCLRQDAEIRHSQRYYYAPEIPVMLTLSLRPVYAAGGLAEGILCTLAEEAIARDGRRLAREQMDRETLRERVRELSRDQLAADELLRAIVRQTPFGVVMFDDQRRLVQMNKAAEQILGVSCRQVLGEACEAFFDCYGECGCCPPMDEKRPLHLRETLSFQCGGKWRTLLRSSVRLQQKDGPVVLEAFVDITERKQAELALQNYQQRLEEMVADRTAELESFSYSVSHDLRTPLRALDGFSKLLLDEFSDDLGETGTHYLDRIRTAAQTLSHLIDSLLALSRIGRVDLELGSTDLSALSERVAQQMRTMEPQREIELSIQQNMQVYADERLLQLVMENLLSNAWKFTRHTKNARIDVTIEVDGDFSRISVSDNGCGFDMRYRDKLFTPFERLHDAAQYPGTGIGLASVARAVGMHGGEVWAQGNPGEGSCFTFSLLRAQANRGQVESSHVNGNEEGLC